VYHGFVPEVLGYGHDQRFPIGAKQKHCYCGEQERQDGTGKPLQADLRDGAGVTVVSLSVPLASTRTETNVLKARHFFSKFGNVEKRSDGLTKGDFFHRAA
jgi:hypothetical protein